MNENRQKAIRLAAEYKSIERQFPASRTVEDKLRTRIAEIASEMYDLGYSLPALILRRQNREHKKYQRKKP